MKITVKLSALRALANLAAQKDIRYYLNGILVEASTDTTRLVATNGHVLGVYNETVEDDNELTNPVSFIIPIEIIKLLKPACKVDIVTIETSDCRNGTIQVFGGTSVNFSAVDGKFPDYVRVIPETVTNEVAQFNPEYIEDFRKAYKLLGAKTFAIRHNGNSGAIVDFNMSNFLGVMMPMRVTIDDVYNPSQFKKPVYVKPVELHVAA